MPSDIYIASWRFGGDFIQSACTGEAFVPPHEALAKWGGQVRYDSETVKQYNGSR